MLEPVELKYEAPGEPGLGEESRLFAGGPLLPRVDGAVTAVLTVALVLFEISTASPAAFDRYNCHIGDILVVVVFGTGG